MPLFASPTTGDHSTLEGEVTSVDAIRKACQVKTAFGQNLTGVIWLNHCSPRFGDRVLMNTSTTNAIIIGVLPKIGTDTDFAVNIDSDGSQVISDTGNYAGLGNGVLNDPDKPGDIIAGDQIISNDAGGLYGLLRGGGFIAKASRLAQIFLSKYDDLVRIVGRNYELFTDMCIDVVANVRGRAYRFIGYSNSLANARNDIYEYQEYYGDTVLGEQLRGNNYGYTPITFAALPAANSVIKKHTVRTAANQLLMRSETNTNGEVLTEVQNAAATSVARFNHTSGLIDTKVTVSGAYTQVKHDGATVTASYNGVNTATISTSSITLSYNNGAQTVVLDGTKVYLSYGSGAHSVTIDNTGVHLA